MQDVPTSSFLRRRRGFGWLSSGGSCSPEHPVLVRRSGDCILMFWGYICLYFLLYKFMSHR